MRELYEIKKELRSCYDELNRLTSNNTTTYHEQVGLDVYEHSITHSPKDIMRVKNRIEELQREIRQREAWDNDAPKRQKEAEELDKRFAEQVKRERNEAMEKKKREEQKRLLTFKEIKKRYKAAGKKHKWERFLNRVNGKNPNWKKIKEYSQEELDYLAKIQSGETKMQKNRKIYTKEARQKNWDDFIRRANSKIQIRDGIKYEESYHFGM